MLAKAFSGFLKTALRPSRSPHGRSLTSRGSSANPFEAFKPLKLFPNEPVYGSGQLFSTDLQLPAPFRRLRSWYNSFLYSFKYDEQFSVKDFIVGVRFVFLKLSKLLNDGAMNEISSLVPDTLFSKLTPALGALTVDQKRKLFNFQEIEKCYLRSLYWELRNDPSNPHILYMDCMACYNCMHRIEDFTFLGKDLKSFTSEAISKLMVSVITANLVFSKQVEPKVDEDWTLTNFNYMRLE